MQRELPGDMLLEVGYIGNSAHKLMRRTEGNYALPGPGDINARRRYHSILVPGTGVLVGPLAGTVSGMVGALFGTMGSMFFVIFLDTHSLPKAQFRATMSAMLLLLSTVRGIGYYAVGEFTAESWIMFAAAFPAMLAGIYAGERIQLRFNEAQFRRVACATLCLCGITLLLK